jgi:RNA polymerase sigma-70 factor (ECF subfamily)
MLGRPATGTLATALAGTWQVSGPGEPGIAGPARCRTPMKESTLEQRPTMERFLAEVERRALRLAQLSVGDRDEALDIVQDAMIRLVRGYGDRAPGEWRPLFYRILSNRITDHQRRQSVRRRIMAWLSPKDDDDQDGEDPLAALPDTGQPGPERRAQQDAALVALEAALASLPARQREAFLLRTLEGLDVTETAQAMGCSEGSVKTHYFRAVHGLRAALGEHWP